jgi:hypothetical protein
LISAVTKLLVPMAVISLFAGILIAGIRGPAIITGLAMLLTAWFIQKMTLETYNPKAVEETDPVRGELRFDTPSNLVIADNWTMEKCLQLERLNGNYGVEVLKTRRSQAVFVDAIRLYRYGTVDGEPRICLCTVSVNSGWLMFLNQKHATELFCKQNAEKTRTILTSLRADEPLLLWVRSKDNAIVGVVIATGDGVGEYEIAYTIVDELVTELVVEFGVT